MTLMLPEETAEAVPDESMMLPVEPPGAFPVNKTTLAEDTPVSVTESVNALTPVRATMLVAPAVDETAVPDRPLTAKMTAL